MIRLPPPTQVSLRGFPMKTIRNQKTFKACAPMAAYTWTPRPEFRLFHASLTRPYCSATWRARHCFRSSGPHLGGVGRGGEIHRRPAKRSFGSQHQKFVHMAGNALFRVQGGVSGGHGLQRSTASCQQNHFIFKKMILASQCGARGTYARICAY